MIVVVQRCSNNLASLYVSFMKEEASIKLEGFTSCCSAYKSIFTLALAVIA